MTTPDLAPDLANDLETLERTLRGADATVSARGSRDRLVQNAAGLVADGRGILAADESDGTASKRLSAIGLPDGAESRRRYRQLLFTSPGLGEHVSGVILYDETIRQSADDGRTLVQVLADQNIASGIKLDTGTAPLAGHPGEEITTGLDALRVRIEEYAAMGATFAKWRAVIRIGDGIPSIGAMQANTHAMARYAALCQEAGIVAMVEPEVLLEGDHSMARCEEVTTATLAMLYDQLRAQRVVLEGTILKSSMVLPGPGAGEQPSADEVATATVRCLRATVPAAVPGVAFLSGGQTTLGATERLDAINRTGPQPWRLTFSYARALQGAVLETWDGTDTTVEAAQAVLVHRARCNGAAATGTYKSEMESPAA